jgi:RHS repeat-associated protein
VNASTGALTANRTYTVFGQPEQPVADPVGFGGQAGYYTDAETGYVLCTARYYDATLGRWLTRDPIGYAGGIEVKVRLAMPRTGISGRELARRRHLTA